MDFKKPILIPGLLAMVLLISTHVSANTQEEEVVEKSNDAKYDYGYYGGRGGYYGGRGGYYGGGGYGGGGYNGGGYYGRGVYHGGDEDVEPASAPNNDN